MKEFVETQVKNAIRKIMLEDGLKSIIKLSYNDLDFDLEDVFVPRLKDHFGDSEFDRLHDECEAISKSTFNEIRRQLRHAYAIIVKALSPATS